MRHTRVVTIDAPGRDNGKAFLLTEMSAARGEAWAIKVLLALAHSGVEMPDGATQGGLQSLAVVGIKAMAGLKWEDAEPLLDEMMTCVQRIPDQKQPAVVRSLIDDDTEEISTRLTLRKAVLELLTGFLSSAGSLI